MSGELEPVAKDGELKHGQLKEATYPWSISTFGKILKISRQDVVNDDLGFISETAPLFGKMAARGVSDLVWQTILANADSFFSTGKNNLLESGSNLSLTSLGQAVARMRSQRDADGNDIDIRPSVLAVPPELETTARSILNSEEIAAAIESGDTAGGPTGNALRNIAQLEVESRLSNADKFSGASATGWYLFGSPLDAPIVVGFLDGVEMPTIEFFGLEHDINTLGLGFRVYFDYGAALGDYRAAVAATGATGE